MSNEDIRPSLSYFTYISHSRSLKIAADENLKLFLEHQQEVISDKDETKGIGLLNSTMLLYAVSVELIFKARGLFEEKENIQDGEINDFNQFMKIWKNGSGTKNGHDFLKIKEYYDFEVAEKYLKVFNELLNFTSWAGRFPFPKKEEDIKLLENNETSRGKLNVNYNIKIGQFIDEQIRIMTQ